MSLLIRIYRAWPFRPHCRSAMGIHSALCWYSGFLADGEPIVPNCRHRK